jgi:homoserine kinase
MTAHGEAVVTPLRLRLPATSANLGPGFDALGLAMALYLTIEATVAEGFHIDASGRDAEQCGVIEDNLILTTYVDVLASEGILARRLHLKLHNEIPLGMGCGSSASALLAGVLLANHFGGLNWSRQQILDEACRREGHPDNVAACYLGGMTISSVFKDSVVTATCGEKLDWSLLLALPAGGLATSKARALLPVNYPRADAVANIQATALLVAAFCQGRPDLLRTAMQDRLHQPYRMQACPLLPLLLPLAEDPSVLGVALSGAGPSILLIAEQKNADAVTDMIRRVTGNPILEILQTRISSGATQE